MRSACKCSVVGDILHFYHSPQASSLAHSCLMQMRESDFTSSVRTSVLEVVANVARAKVNKVFIDRVSSRDSVRNAGSLAIIKREQGGDADGRPKLRMNGAIKAHHKRAQKEAIELDISVRASGKEAAERIAERLSNVSAINAGLAAAELPPATLTSGTNPSPLFTSEER